LKLNINIITNTKNINSLPLENINSIERVETTDNNGTLYIYSNILMDSGFYKMSARFNTLRNQALINNVFIIEDIPNVRELEQKIKQQLSLKQ